MGRGMQKVSQDTNLGGMAVWLLLAGMFRGRGGSVEGVG